jgi:hypothetical protein
MRNPPPKSITHKKRFCVIGFTPLFRITRMKASEQQRQRNQRYMKTNSLVRTANVLLTVAFLCADSVQAAKATPVHNKPVPSRPKPGPAPKPSPPAPMPDRRPQAPYVPPGPGRGGRVQPGPFTPPAPMPGRRPQDPYVGPGPGRGGWLRPVPAPPPAPRSNAVHPRKTSPCVTTQDAVSIGTQDANLLSNAYSLLAQADDTYHGHRTRAMRQISAAAKLLGAPPHSDGVDGAGQLTSDEQVRQAQALLAQAGSFYAGRPDVLNHVTAAHRQVSVALNTR